jgi:hypothetical protein
MHNAPAVSYPVGRSRFQAQLFSAVSLAGLLASAGWFAQVQTPGWQQWLMLFGAVMTAMGAYWQWRQTVVGQLTREGSSWSWTESDASVSVQLVLIVDVQQAMLLLLRGVRSARGIWIWVERDASPTRWLALRRAAYQRPRADTDPLVDGSPLGMNTA